VSVIEELLPPRRGYTAAGAEKRIVPPAFPSGRAGLGYAKFFARELPERP